MEKELYAAPEMEIIEFESEDIVTNSMEGGEESIDL